MAVERLQLAGEKIGEEKRREKKRKEVKTRQDKTRQDKTRRRETERRKKDTRGEGGGYLLIQIMDIPHTRAVTFFSGKLSIPL